MRQYFLPVWGASRFTASKQMIGIDRWWDEAPLHYGHALVSYVHWKMPLVFPPSSYIFGDSGGFTLRNPTKITIDPVDVLRWQVSQCTVGCLLDLPPTGTKRRIWLKGMEVTLAHTKRALPVYTEFREEQPAHRFRWWGVLHGNSTEEVKQYHKAVSDIYPFTDEGEGWAIRAEPLVNIYSVARSFRVLKQLGIKRVHFLAATSQKVIAVLLGLGVEAGMELITYDSTTAIKNGFNRNVFVLDEGGITFHLMTEKNDDFHGRNFCLHECPCSVCEHMRLRSMHEEKGKRELYDKKFGGWWSTWLQFHNLETQRRLVEGQAALAKKDPDALLRTMLSSDEYFKVMRTFTEEGHEPAAAWPAIQGSARSLLDYMR